MVEFLYRKYAEENLDVAEQYGPDAEADLLNHFREFGQAELRGGEIDHYFRLEGLLMSDRGDLLLCGWADRRILPVFRMTIEVGYQRHVIDADSLRWYNRPDVNALTGDTGDAGFVAVLRLPDIVLHPRVRVCVNDRIVRQETVMRWTSANRFLDQALAAVSMLADQPIGRTLDHARKMSRPFRQIWMDTASDMSFTLAFDTRKNAAVDRSIIIVLYRKAPMLLTQLETLAAYLEQTATEIVLVANDMINPYPLVEDLTAFCQLHDVQISLHLCSGNSGFAIANNHGAEIARGRTLILMNPDIFPAERAPKQSLDFLSRDPGRALHGTLLYYGDGMLMHSGMYTTADRVYDPHGASTSEVLRVEHFGKGLMHRIDDPQETLAGVMAPVRAAPALATAALWKISKAQFEEFEGLSLDYIYAYYEDADFCLRFLEAGESIVIDDSSRWFHLEGVGKTQAPHVRSFMWLNRTTYSERFADSPFVADRSVDLTAL